MSKASDNESFALAAQRWLGVTADGWAGVGTMAAFLDKTGQAAPAATAGVIDPARFAAWAPKAVAGAREALEAAAAKHAISGRALASFLGQYHHESAGFSQMTESLNYSVEGLLKTFGRHRISEADAIRFGRSSAHPADQESLGNILYGGAWGSNNLGNTKPGDGWRFRARGFGGTTGRTNYREAGYEDNPDALLNAAVSAEVSAAFFVARGCVPLAMSGLDEAVTRKINGGVNGLADRIERTRQAMEIIR
jgi:putative chitinase